MVKRSSTAYRLETLLKAAQLYEGLASGKYKLYNARKYEFLDPDCAVAQDRALALRNVMKELESGESS
jgi:hypothetical protein